MLVEHLPRVVARGLSETQFTHNFQRFRPIFPSVRAARPDFVARADEDETAWYLKLDELAAQSPPPSSSFR